ncbi:MAG: phosphohydrolase [Pseudomonadota bacterium]
MSSKCPGQDSRNIRISIHRCQKCGADVEMFSDELRVACRLCGELVYREKHPSCIEWCKGAKQCLGEERWAKLVESLMDNKSKGDD